MKKLMVTGGSGFIGSNFIRYMLSEYPQYRISNYDILTYAGNPENLKDIEHLDNYQFIHGDIDDLDKAIEAMKDCDAVINFAAESHVDRSIGMARQFMMTNVVGTQTLLEAARDTNIARFVHVSTDEIYGSIEQGSFFETDRPMPSSPYSASKAASDLLCHAYQTTHDMPIIVTRSSNNFGPYQFPEKLIPLLITNILEGKQLPIYGDGKNVRDWIFVEDNCAAIDLVLHKGQDGEIYNIGGGNEVQNIDIANMILAIMDQPKSRITFVDDRLGHDRRYSINSDKLLGLGFHQKFDFAGALKKTVAWYVDNEKWWRRLKQEEYASEV